MTNEVVEVPNLNWKGYLDAARTDLFANKAENIYASQMGIGVKKYLAVAWRRHLIHTFAPQTKDKTTLKLREMYIKYGSPSVNPHKAAHKLSQKLIDYINQNLKDIFDNLKANIAVLNKIKLNTFEESELIEKHNLKNLSTNDRLAKIDKAIKKTKDADVKLHLKKLKRKELVKSKIELLEKQIDFHQFPENTPWDISFNYHVKTLIKNLARNPNTPLFSALDLTPYANKIKDDLRPLFENNFPISLSKLIGVKRFLNPMIWPEFIVGTTKETILRGLDILPFGDTAAAKSLKTILTLPITAIQFSTTFTVAKVGELIQEKISELSKPKSSDKTPNLPPPVEEKIDPLITPRTFELLKEKKVRKKTTKRKNKKKIKVEKIQPQAIQDQPTIHEDPVAIIEQPSKKPDNEISSTAIILQSVNQPLVKKLNPPIQSIKFIELPTLHFTVDLKSETTEENVITPRTPKSQEASTPRQYSPRDSEALFRAILKKPNSTHKSSDSAKFKIN